MKHTFLICLGLLCMMVLGVAPLLEEAQQRVEKREHETRKLQEARK